MKPLIALLLLCVAAALPAEDVAAGCINCSGELRVSEVRGAPVTTPAGVALGTVEDVLLDVRAKGIHYALLAVPADSSGSDPKHFAYPVTALETGPTSALLLDVRPENLRIAPGYDNRTWPDKAFRDDSRYVLASNVVGATARDALGNPIARIEDVVISLRTGLTERVIFDFDDGAVLSLPAHAVQLRPAGAVILGDSGRRA